MLFHSQNLLLNHGSLMIDYHTKWTLQIYPHIAQMAALFLPESTYTSFMLISSLAPLLAHHNKRMRGGRGVSTLNYWHPQLGTHLYTGVKIGSHKLIG